MDQRFAPALGTIQKLLEAIFRQINTPIRFALIGGLAVSAWGSVRATQGIDFLADSDPSPIDNTELRDKLKKLIERHRCRVEWRIGEYDDPIPLLLRIELSRRHGNLGADILWAHKRWQREALSRTIAVNVSRQRVQLLHPEDLILMKLEAGGPQDFLDVQGLLTVRPRQLDLRRLKRSATRLRLKQALDECLGRAGARRKR
jgi:hypothetical protein